MTTAESVFSSYEGLGYEKSAGVDWEKRLDELGPRPEPESKTGEYIVIASKPENEKTLELAVEFHFDTIKIVVLHTEVSPSGEFNVKAYEFQENYDWGSNKLVAAKGVVTSTVEE